MVSRGKKLKNDEAKLVKNSKLAAPAKSEAAPVGVAKPGVLWVPPSARAPAPPKDRPLKPGEKTPTFHDPSFLIRCRCGGSVRGTFAKRPASDFHPDERAERRIKGPTRPNVLKGVKCDSCSLTYTVERPQALHA